MADAVKAQEEAVVQEVTQVTDATADFIKTVFPSALRLINRIKNRKKPAPAAATESK